MKRNETARQEIDRLIELQKMASAKMENSAIRGFDLINARHRWHSLDKQIDRLCRESGERRVA
jgi:hypothetical protein